MKSKQQTSKVTTVSISFSQQPSTQIHNLNPYLFKRINPTKTIIQKIQQNKLAKTHALNFTESKEVLLRQTVDFCHYRQPSNQQILRRKKVKYHTLFDNIRTCLTEGNQPQHHTRPQIQPNKEINKKQSRNSFEYKHKSDKLLKHKGNSSKPSINPYTNNQYKYIRSQQIDSALQLRHSTSFKKNRNSITQSYKVSPIPLTPKLHSSFKFITNVNLYPKHAKEKNFSLSPWSFAED